MNNVSKIDQFKAETTISLMSANSPHALKEQTIKILNSIGFSDFDLAHLNHENSFDALISTFPAALYDTYIEENMYEYDATVECVTQSSVPIYFADTFRHIASSPYDSVRRQKNLLLYELMRSYGHEDGYCMPVQANGFSGKFSFFLMAEGESSANIKSLVKEERAKLNHLINTLSFLMAQPKMSHALNPSRRPVLTTRQREVLNALANFAKTNQEVADHLGITVRTVAKHVEDIKISLGARSMPHAVSLAIGYGLILPAVR